MKQYEIDFVFHTFLCAAECLKHVKMEDLKTRPIYIPIIKYGLEEMLKLVNSICPDEPEK